MLSQAELLAALDKTVDEVNLSGFGEKIQGKVRDIYKVGTQRILITTDRISAFDRVLGLIPYKGQVLNQLSAWWFEQTQDIVQNHVISVPDPNVTLAREAQALPVEVVVRGYITGVTSTSLWTMYEKGERRPYGIALPDGLQKNDRLPQPIITPTTKAEHGHDEQITRAEILERGLVAPAIWDEIEHAALAVFQRGQTLAKQSGMILVDTKYEFGLIDGRLALIDEIHTPDSSRYWTESSYATGKPENISKEFLREWFKAQGYNGEGRIPIMPNEFIVQVAARYIQVYESLTGQAFFAGASPAAERIAQNLASFAR